MIHLHDNLEWFGAESILLDRLASSLPSSTRWQVTVCGSSPLRLWIESAPVSGEPAPMNPYGCRHWLNRAEQAGGNQVHHQSTTVELIAPEAFASTFDWRARALTIERHWHLFRFVHPWDVLVSKLQRLDESCLDAFRLVISRTGHPTEQEFLRHLQNAVDLYRPKFDEESQRGDMVANTRVLWRELWGRDIDPRAEIIRPAVERVNRVHSDFDPTLKDRLAKLGATAPQIGQKQP